MGKPDSVLSEYIRSGGKSRHMAPIFFFTEDSDSNEIRDLIKSRNQVVAFLGTIAVVVLIGWLVYSAAQSEAQI